MEVIVPGEQNGPTKKPDFVKNPGNKVPTAHSLNLSEPDVFNAPNSTASIINDLFPTFNQPTLDGMPGARKSALDTDFSKTIGALPAYVLNPVDKALTSADGPGYSDLSFKTQKPEIPNPNDGKYIWCDPKMHEFSKENVEWYTFLSHDTYFNNSLYQLKSTQLLSADVSMRERLTNRALQISNGIWKNTIEDYPKEIIFAPDLDTENLSWAEIVAYVNYYLIHEYLDGQAIIVPKPEEIVLDAEDEDEDLKTTVQNYLKNKVIQETSLLLYQDKISAIRSYNVRKILNSLFQRDVNGKFIQSGSDESTAADGLCMDLVALGVSTTLEQLRGKSTFHLSDLSIKDEISKAIGDYIEAPPSNINLAFSSVKTVAAFFEQVAGEFISQGIFEIEEKEEILGQAKTEIRSLFLSLVSDLVLSEVRKYKLQSQISAINKLLSSSEPVKLQESESAVSIAELKRPLEYIKSRLILLKNENHIPEQLTVNDIIDGKPSKESDEVFEHLTGYLNGEVFNIKQFVDSEVRETVTQAIHGVINSELTEKKIRTAIKTVTRDGNEGATRLLTLSEREDVRYALSKECIAELEASIVDRVLSTTTTKADGSLVISLVDGKIAELPIKNWIEDGLETFLQKEEEDVEKYAFSKDLDLRNDIRQVLHRTLKLGDSYDEDDSPLVQKIEEQINEETLVLAYKARTEAQLNKLQSIIMGQTTEIYARQATEIDDDITISAQDATMERLLEYIYAKILKDNYTPIIYNDFVKYAKTLDGWFDKASTTNACQLLIKKIGELRKHYGTYYEAIQQFPQHGKAYLIPGPDAKTYSRYPELINEHELFTSFFTKEEATLNIANFLADYQAIYDTYGKPCYAQRGKYNISDYSVELSKIVEKYVDLKQGDDIFAGAVFMAMQDEQIALKRELEAIDLFEEYDKAKNFRQELREYMTGSTIAGWRTDAIKLEALTSKIYSIAVDHGIMRVNSDKTYSSGRIMNALTMEGEKEYNECAGSYLYVSGILESIKAYNIDQDISVLVLQILDTIEAYKGADLYQDEELLSQLKYLLTSTENIPYTSRTSLFSTLTKYINSSNIDFSLVTLFSSVYPTVKNMLHVPDGIKNIMQTITVDASNDIRNQMTACVGKITALRNVFSTFLTSEISDTSKYTNLFSALGALVQADLTIGADGDYAYMVNQFVGACNTVIGGISDSDFTNLLQDGITNEKFNSIKGKLSVIRDQIEVMLQEVSQNPMRDVNQAYLQKAIQDLQTLLNHIEVILFLDIMELNHPTWYTGGGRDTLIDALQTAYGSDSPIGNILQPLITSISNNVVGYDLLEHLDNTILPLKGFFNQGKTLPTWLLDGLKQFFIDSNYNINEKFTEYGEKFSTLNKVIFDLTTKQNFADAKNAINQLEPISLLTGKVGADSADSVDKKNLYVYIANQVLGAYNDIVNFLRQDNGAIQTFLNKITAEEKGIKDVLDAFEEVQRALAGFITEFGTKRLASVAKGVHGEIVIPEFEALAVTDVLNGLLDIIQRNQKSFFSNILAILYPEWNSKFEQLTALQETLKGYIEEDGTEIFSISKNDYLNLIEAIDVNAHFNPFLEGVDEGVEFEDKKISDVKTEIDKIQAVMPGSIVMGDNSVENASKIEDVASVYREFGDFQTLYNAIHDITTGNSSAMNRISKVVAIAEPFRAVKETNDDEYDRSRWLNRQFTLVYNEIVGNIRSDSGSLTKAYVDALSALAKDNRDPNKYNLISSFTNSNGGLYTRIRAIIGDDKGTAGLNQTAKILTGFIDGSEGYESTPIEGTGDRSDSFIGTTRWDDIPDLSELPGLGKQVTLNGTDIYIGKFVDVSTGTEFYIIQETVGEKECK
ncbi:MAG: hypothetical protein LBJ13_01750, partial [Puniceicoccales bacterium]|nr:hypothetical protein [Puniceicoccales bacterium]